MLVLLVYGPGAMVAVTRFPVDAKAPAKPAALLAVQGPVKAVASAKNKLWLFEIKLSKML